MSVCADELIQMTVCVGGASRSLEVHVTKAHQHAVPLRYLKVYPSNPSASGISSINGVDPSSILDG
jgi:hypothetical protein